MNPGGVSQSRPKFSNDFKDLACTVKLHSEDPGGVSSLGPEFFNDFNGLHRATEVF